MNQAWTFISENGAVPVVTAIIALTGVFLSAIVSAIVSRRSSYISSVTVERSKWIDKLRSNLADLLGVLGSIHLKTADKVYSGSASYFEDRKRADTLIATITLQLNPRGAVDKNMIQLLEKMPTEAERAGSDYRKAEKALILHSQFLLKEEWEKVKYESRLGIMRCLAWSGQRRRECEYTQFSRQPEAFLNSRSTAYSG